MIAFSQPPSKPVPKQDARIPTDTKDYFESPPTLNIDSNTQSVLDFIDLLKAENQDIEGLKEYLNSFGLDKNALNAAINTIFQYNLIKNLASDERDISVLEKKPKLTRSDTTMLSTLRQNKEIQDTSLAENNKKINDILQSIFILEGVDKLSYMQREHLKEIKIALTSYQLFHSKKYRLIENRIEDLNKDFKLTNREMITRIVLAGYSAIGFAGGIAGTILVFVPLVAFVNSIRIAVHLSIALISVKFEHSDKTSQARAEDHELQLKVQGAHEALKKMSENESALQHKCYPYIEEIYQLAKQQKKLRPNNDDIDEDIHINQPLTMPAIVNCFKKKLGKIDHHTQSHVNDLHRAMQAPVKKHSLRHNFYVKYGLTLRTFIGGTLTLYGSVGTALTLAGIAVLPVLGIILASAVVLNVAIAYFFHKMNIRSQKRNGELEAVHKKLYNDTLDRLVQVENLKKSLKVKCMKLKESIAQIEKENLMDQNKILANHNDLLTEHKDDLESKNEVLVAKNDALIAKKNDLTPGLPGSPSQQGIFSLSQKKQTAINSPIFNRDANAEVLRAQSTKAC